MPPRGDSPRRGDRCDAVATVPAPACRLLDADEAMRSAGLVKVTLTLAVVSASGAGCAMDHLIRRASNELECAPERVNVLERHDIAYEVYDVEACGRRVRYSCVGGGRGGVYGCVHEPEPPKWGP